MGGLGKCVIDKLRNLLELIAVHFLSLLEAA